MRELSPAARGGQEARSRNLGPVDEIKDATATIPPKCTRTRRRTAVRLEASCREKQRLKRLVFEKLENSKLEFNCAHFKKFAPMIILPS